MIYCQKHCYDMTDHTLDMTVKINLTFVQFYIYICLDNTHFITFTSILK